MVKRGGGITCTLALSVHALFVVLVLVSGTTRGGICYTEALLLLGGSTAAMLGGLVMGGRSSSDRTAIGIGLGMTLLAISWMLWVRDQFALDGQAYWFNRIFSFYDPLPRPNAGWISATLKFVTWMLGVVVVLVAIQAVGRRLLEFLATKSISRRALLIGLAVFLYLGYVIQSRLLHPENGLIGDSVEKISSFWLIPLAILAVAILASTFYLPRFHRYAWLILVCMSIVGYSIEIRFRKDLLVRGTITSLLIIGFIGSGIFLRRSFRHETNKSEQPGLQIGRVALMVAPAVLLVLAGWMFARTVDVGQWVMSQDYALATRVASLRESGIAIDRSPWGTVEVVLCRNAPASAFDEILRDWPNVSLRYLDIDGMRTDIDVAPLAAGAWLNGPVGLGGGLQFLSGELSVLQLGELLKQNDVNVNANVLLVESDAGLAGLSNLNSLHVYGNAKSIVALFKTLKPNKSIDTLTVTIHAEAERATSAEFGGEVALMLLENSWGKRLVVNFMVPLGPVEWPKPGGECPWESIQYNLNDMDWKFLPGKMSGPNAWPIRLSTRRYEFDKQEDEILFLRGAIGSNGLISPMISSVTLRALAENSFQLGFERLDCVVRRDEQGKPVALLALDADWIAHLSDDQASGLDSLWIGSEWGGVEVYDLADLPAGSAFFLGRCTGLRRLGLGLNQFDDYSFLQKMPDLREFQVPVETAPERIADLAANLKFVPKLEVFQISGIPATAVTIELAKLPNLKEVVLAGIEEWEVVDGPLDGLRKILPGVEIRLLPEPGFSALRPADLVEHQKGMLERVMEEIELQKAAENGKKPEE